jgi:hypothetical protein
MAYPVYVAAQFSKVAVAGARGAHNSGGIEFESDIRPNSMRFAVLLPEIGAQLEFRRAGIDPTY